MLLEEAQYKELSYMSLSCATAPISYVTLPITMSVQEGPDVALREAVALARCGSATLQALYAVAEQSDTPRQLEVMLTR